DSINSPSVPVVPGGDIGIPTDVQAAEVPGADAVDVSWLLPEFNGTGNPLFTVTLNPGNITQTVPFAEAEGDNGAGVGGPAPGHLVLTGLAPGTYTAQVTAVGDNGTSVTSLASDPVTVQGVVPTPPSGLTATPGDSDVDL